MLFDYPAALTAIVLVVYAAVRGGRAAVLATVAGGVPAAVVLGSYNWLAFGAPSVAALLPLHRQLLHRDSERQGFFGVRFPTPHGVWTLLLDGRGLLLVSPVLVISVAGLVRFWRRRRLEASVAGVIALSFLLYTSGYFLPNERGLVLLPGPRFAAASLPFLFAWAPFCVCRLVCRDLGACRSLGRDEPLQRTDMVGDQPTRFRCVARHDLVSDRNLTAAGSA